MGKRKGSWKKFFCCTGPPETQSSTCVNIGESDHTKPPSEPEQEDEDLYIEAEVQTSKFEIPEGNRWRWSRLHNEVEVQTSYVSLPIEEAESSSETDAHIQTTFLSFPREAEAQAQTSFLSLWNPAPFETDAQVQTSFTELPREMCAEAQAQTSLLSLPREIEPEVQKLLLSLPGEREAQVQTSLLSLPGEREAQVQTSFLSLPREREAQKQTSLLSLPREREAQKQTSLLSLPREREAQVQTSLLSLPREREAQVQTSLLSLPREREAQKQTSLLSLPREMEAQVQTSLLSLPREREAQVQTSLLSLPREREAQKQTSLLSLPREREAQKQTSLLSLPREREAQVQTSLLSLPREMEAQVQTSLLSLPREREAQKQTSLLSLRREMEAQVQTSLLSLPREMEAQVQTSLLSLPEREFLTSFQTQPSYIEVLEKIASLPIFAEAHIQTSNLEMYPSETDFQVQTSFSDYMSEKEDTASIEHELERSASQLSEVDRLYVDAQVQTLPVEIPPGNDWRSTRLKAAVQVQTSDSSLEKPVLPPEGVIQLQPSKLSLGNLERMAEELEAIKQEKSLLSKPIETGIQTPDSKTEEEDQRSLSQLQPNVQPSTIELLKKLSVLSQIETMESTSRTELLKKVSSLSVTEPHMQSSSYALQRKPSSLSESAPESQTLGAELLRNRSSSAQVIPTSDYEQAGEFCFSSPTREVQIQTSDLELMKKASSSSLTEPQARTSGAALRKLSSLSLVKTRDGNQEEIIEGRKYLVTPQLTEAQIRKWYHEFPEVQTASQAPVERDPLLSLTVDSEVQTSFVEIPWGNRWRESRLQAEAQVQTSGLELAEEEMKSWDNTQTQTSLLEVWQARGLADAQMQTSDLDLAKTIVEQPPPLVMDSQVQTLLHDVWKAKEKADLQTQTSVAELSEALPTEQIDVLAQTSFLEIPEEREPGHVQEKASEFLEPKEEDFPLQTDLEEQTSLPDMWRGKEKTDIQVQKTDLEEQTSLPDMWRGKEKTDIQVQKTDLEEQTSLPDMWRGKEKTDIQVQKTDLEEQTSLPDMWRGKEKNDIQVQKTDLEEQTSLPDMWRGKEKTDIQVQNADVEVQTSLPDMWRGKEKTNIQVQTSFLEAPDAQEELPLSSQTDSVVQNSNVDIPDADAEPQSPMLDMEEEELESPPPSQMDTQVQTSLLDIWKTKDLRHALAQTSQTDASESLEESPLPLPAGNIVQTPTQDTAESLPPSQVNTEAQTSFLDLWKAKEVSSSQAQTSQMDMSESVEEPPVPAQPENGVQSPTLETTKSPPPSQFDSQVQTSFFDIWKAKELSSAPTQTSWLELPQSPEEPLPSQSESPTKIAPPESPPPNQLEPEKKASLLDTWKLREPMERSELPKLSPSSTDPNIQTSQLEIQSPEELPSAQEDLVSATPESAVPSQQMANPVRLPTLADVKTDLPAQTSPQPPTSLLEIWNTRQEAEVQMQTANLGLSFEEGSPLFPILLESQEEKKLEQTLKEERRLKPPIFSEAQVQTSFVEIPRGKKWRSSRICTEVQVQTSFPDLCAKDRMPALQKMVSDHVSAKRVPKGPKRASPVSVHLHVKMSPKRQTSNEKKIVNT